MKNHYPDHISSEAGKKVRKELDVAERYSYDVKAILLIHEK